MSCLLASLREGGTGSWIGQYRICITTFWIQQCLIRVVTLSLLLYLVWHALAADKEVPYIFAAIHTRVRLGGF